MRKFKLINGKGEILSLTNDRISFDNPSGLGISRSNEVQKTKSGQILMSSETEFQNISGDLRFFYEPYLSYRKMAEFCQYTPLFLAYAPEDEFFYREVTLGELGKNEIEKTSNVLNCRLEVIPLSMWYGDVEFNPELIEKRPSFPFSSKHFVYYENKFDDKMWFPADDEKFLTQNNFSHFAITLDISNVNERLKREKYKDDLLRLLLDFYSYTKGMKENIIIIPVANHLNVKEFTFLKVGSHHNSTVLYEFIDNPDYPYDPFVEDIREIYRNIYFSNELELELETNFYEPILEAVDIIEPQLSILTTESGIVDFDLFVKSVKIEGFKSYEAV